MNSINQKLEFMMASGQPVRTTPGTPSIEERKLNLALILEEVYELAEAYGLEGTFQGMMNHKIMSNVSVVDFSYKADTRHYDPVATLDALCDIRVVADGPILSSGLQGVWQEAMAEVHASNMSKFTTDARKALHFAAQTEGNAVLNNGFWCVKNAAGKVQKPDWHFKPDLKSIYERHAHQSSPSS